MEQKLTCCCGAVFHCCDYTAFVAEEAHNWRVAHKECPRLKFEAKAKYKAELEKYKIARGDK